MGGTIDMMSDRNARYVNVKSNRKTKTTLSKYLRSLHYISISSTQKKRILYTSGQETPGVVQGATVAVALPAKKSIDYPSCSDESPIHLSCC